MASGFIEKTMKKALAKIGIKGGEEIVASAHFHSMAFWSSLCPLLALLVGNKWIAFGAFPWGLTIVMAEAGPKGRWIDVWTRAAGCAVGAAFGIWTLVIK